MVYIYCKTSIYFLQYIQSYVGNWGWSIVILTLLLNLFYIHFIQRYGINEKLKDLAPKMKELQAKYKDDKQEQSCI